jgi:elongation factor P
MIPVTDLRKGTTFEQNGVPYIVLEYSHIKMGRGGATIRITTRNLETGAVEEKTFNNGGSVSPITTRKRALQYLYLGDGAAAFMDPMTYEQIEIPQKVLGNDLAYLKEGQKVDVLFWEERPMGIELPPNVTLTVTECDPGVKGNSASNFYKPATFENGLTSKVPLFIKVGDKVRVDTRTGAYVERVAGK